MARVTQAQVAALVPEFAACDPTVASTIIGVAETMVNPNLPPAQINTAECFMVGHLYLSFYPSAGQGPVVSSEKAGDVEAQYKIPEKALYDSPLSTTRYGVLFLMLAKNLGFGVAVAGIPPPVCP